MATEDDADEDGAASCTSAGAASRCARPTRGGPRTRGAQVAGALIVPLGRNAHLRCVPQVEQVLEAAVRLDARVLQGLGAALAQRGEGDDSLHPRGKEGAELEEDDAERPDVEREGLARAARRVRVQRGQPGTHGNEAHAYLIGDSPNRL